MAEGITRLLLLEAGLGDGWTVSSSGLAAFPGDPAAIYALNVLAEMGIDMSDHRSSRTSPYSVEKAQYVFAMTRDHLDHLWRLFPESKDRILLFSDVSQWVPKCPGGFPPQSVIGPIEPDIPDPYGLDIGVYRKVAETIVLYARGLIFSLKGKG